MSGRSTRSGKQPANSRDAPQLLSVLNTQRIRRIFSGEELIFSHPGTSQYTSGGGASACGLAAMNCARVILGKEKSGIRGETLLADMMSRRTLEDIVAICPLWSSAAHLEVEEDIYQVPLFKSELELVRTTYDNPNSRSFWGLLSSLRDTAQSSVVVITRPPEIIACFKIKTSKSDVFVIFDSHPRPKYPDGAAFIFSSSLQATSNHLAKLLAVDGSLFDEPDMDWQTQLLANYSGHIFVSRGAPLVNDNLTATILDSSLEVLSLKGELAAMKGKAASLTADNTRLGARIDRDTRVRQDELKAQNTRSDTLHAEVRQFEAELNRHERIRAESNSQSTTIETLIEENKRYENEIADRENVYQALCLSRMETIKNLKNEIKELEAALKSTGLVDRNNANRTRLADVKSLRDDVDDLRELERQLWERNLSLLGGDPLPNSHTEASVKTHRYIDISSDDDEDSSPPKAAPTAIARTSNPSYSLGLLSKSDQPTSKARGGDISSDDSDLDDILGRSSARRANGPPSQKAIGKRRDDTQPAINVGPYQPPTDIQHHPPGHFFEEDSDAEAYVRDRRNAVKKRQIEVAKPNREEDFLLAAKMQKDYDAEDEINFNMAKEIQREEERQARAAAAAAAAQQRSRKKGGGEASGTGTGSMFGAVKELLMGGLNRASNLTTTTLEAVDDLDPPEPRHGNRRRDENEIEVRIMQPHYTMAHNRPKHSQRNREERRPKRQDPDSEEEFLAQAKAQIDLENSNPHLPMKTMNRHTLSKEEQRQREERREMMERQRSILKSIAKAAEAQREFEEEDRRLRQERELLMEDQQEVFDCGLCLEPQPTDSVAHVDVCEHEICRECIRGFIVAKLGEGRFPIVCPLCLVDRDRQDQGIVSEFLVQQVGIPEESFARFTELQMLAFSIQSHCRGCNNTVYIDKEEFQEASIISCPLPDCVHRWCKNCQQAVEFGGPEHSCDGTKELDRLKQAEGWKNCPGCTTLIQKDQGCNHMTCVTPSCNTHFCYVCGESIVRSTSANAVQAAVGSHFSKCQLFEVPDDD